jgi:hypothetical protein
MALIDDVKSICDRLAPLGWRSLLKAVSKNALDIGQNTAAALKAALTAPIPNVDRTFPGFEDFDTAPARGITAAKPSQSLLYHALASPSVVRDEAGKLLQGFATMPEIETVENFIFGMQPPTLAAIKQSVGNAKLAVAVFATEYRPCPDTADGQHADLTFSRTGIARVGTARPKYLPDVRGYWSENEDNPHGFRVIPVRLTAWLAVAMPGAQARVMRLETANAKEKKRTFWIPVHKLFDGPECIQGFDLALACSVHLFNMKLQRVMKSLGKNVTGFPFVIEHGLGELVERTEHGRIAVVPVVQDALVKPAIVNGKPVTYQVPKGKAQPGGFATYMTEAPLRPDETGAQVEIHRFPAYVHARTQVTNGAFVDLNEQANVDVAVNKGGYNALMYMDMTGEGWVDVQVGQLAGAAGVEAASRPAYLLLSAPDLFPSCGQRELSRWSVSKEIPASFRNGQIWGVEPTPLSEMRKPANLQLPQTPFEPKDDTMTAVVGMGSGAGLPSLVRVPDALRASTLPDDGAGVFAPGWDVAVDVKGAVQTGIMHLAAYGLGSPFPEDAKLCAALSTFWPAVAPDVYRTMPIHTGNQNFRGTVAPLTDEEIGQIGNQPWDGVAGPQLVQDGVDTFVEMASFLNVDYVTNAAENRFNNRLISRVSAEEYQRRVLVAARVHWILSGRMNVWPTRTQWLILSFRRVSDGNPELQSAQDHAGHVLEGRVYRVEACFVGDGSSITASPRGPRFRRLPLRQRNFFFASPSDPVALRRRDSDTQWAHTPAE